MPAHVRVHIWALEQVCVWIKAWYWGHMCAHRWSELLRMRCLRRSRGYTDPYVCMSATSCIHACYVRAPQNEVDRRIHQGILRPKDKGEEEGLGWLREGRGLREEEAV